MVLPNVSTVSRQFYFDVKSMIFARIKGMNVDSHKETVKKSPFQILQQHEADNFSYYFYYHFQKPKR